MELPDPELLLEEQVSYYRARAPEYDDWWEGTGAWRRPDAVAGSWRAETSKAIDALIEFDARGDVLEVAAGTGNLTRHLARSAERLTAIDTSPEALAIARTKLATEDAVDLVVADVFDWEPPRRFDAIVFGFWISHVPPALFASFWARIDRALIDGGRVFLVDNSIGEARGTLPTVARTWPDQGVSRRTLSDGRSYWIVKRGWSPTELESDLFELGWSAAAVETGAYFIHATATRSHT